MKRELYDKIFDIYVIAAVLFPITILGFFSLIRPSSMGKVNFLSIIIFMSVFGIVLVQFVMKPYFGRVRPIDLTIFGGHGDFTQLLEKGKCLKDCSTPSGHCSFAFTLFFLHYLRLPAVKNVVITSYVVINAIVIGMWSIARGAHFFSDVIFSAFFMLCSGILMHKFLGIFHIKRVKP